MTGRGLVVVTDEAAADEPLPFAVSRRVVTAEASSPDDLARTADTDHDAVLWLPAWARLDERAASEVRAWLERMAAGDVVPGTATGLADAGAAARPSVARARLHLVSREATLLLREPRVVLSSPGAVDVVGEVPAPRAGALVEELATPWDLVLPPSLDEHLAAVNRQSGVAARLRFAAGVRPAWRDLAWTPVASVLRDLVRLDGSRRAGLPRLVVEAYREVLVSAKLWELRHGAGPA